MTAKLFVGGLPWSTTDEGLKAAFDEYGTVEEANVVRERDSGRSRGFGFVTFSTEEEAQAAVQGMDGQEIEGRQVRVESSQSKPRPPRRNNF